MPKITVVGGGNAGCFTALYCAWKGKQTNSEVELIYNPEIPPEKVGQATVLEPPGLLWATTGFNWYNNNINATMKSGIYMKVGVKLIRKYLHLFPLIVWQCITALGKCKKVFYNLVILK